MATQTWTKEQFAGAMQQIEDEPAFDGFLDYSEPEVVDALLDVFCERNKLRRALADWMLTSIGTVDGPTGEGR